VYIVQGPVIEKLKFISTYAYDVDDWVTIKKELLKQLPVSERKCFSKRDGKTKRINLNEFEKNLIVQWKQFTGKDLTVNGTKI